MGRPKGTGRKLTEEERARVEQALDDVSRTMAAVQYALVYLRSAMEQLPQFRVSGAQMVAGRERAGLRLGPEGMTRRLLGKSEDLTER